MSWTFIIVLVAVIASAYWYQNHTVSEASVSSSPPSSLSSSSSSLSSLSSSNPTCGAGGSLSGGGEGPTTVSGDKYLTAVRPLQHYNEIRRSPVPVQLSMKRTLRGATSNVPTPAAWDWRNVANRSQHPLNLPEGNYCTQTLNQHSPVYCGSCWAHASLSTVGDRYEILRRKTQAPGPQIALSVQVVLNCAHDAGTCHGGDHAPLYDYLQKTGIPSETCAHYAAVDGTCDPISVCKTCWPGANFFNGGFDSECCAVPNPPMYKIEGSRHISNNIDDIKREIFMNGPVSTSVDCSSWVNILPRMPGDPITLVGNDNTCGNTNVDHQVAIVGYGSLNGVDYWIVRNSWGSFWGDQGFVYLKQGCYQVEQDVIAPYPTGYSAAGF
jgi:hypothetical protein